MAWTETQDAPSDLNRRGPRHPCLVHGPKEDGLRTHAAQVLVNKLSPDVLVINEALWCAPLCGHLRDYAALFGYEYSKAQLYDGNWGNVLLSRYPLEDELELRIYNRGGFVSSIRTPQGLVQVGTYHPHPSRFPENKRRDFRRILRLFEEDLPGVLMGDFNMVSPEDDADLDRLERGFRRFSPKPREDAARFLDAGKHVVPVFEQAGWRDAVAPKQRRTTMPTRMLDKDGKSDSAMRLDHAWVSAITNVVWATPVVDPLADQESDHYPLLVEIA